CIYSHNPIINTRLSQRPPQHVSRNSVERLLQVHKCYTKVFFLCQVLFLNLPDYEYSVCGASSWPKSKLHVIQADQISHLPFYYSLKNLHHLIKQLYPSVRTTFKSISFTFVHAYHPTLFPICWNSTSLTIALNKSVSQEIPVSPDTVKLC